MSTRGVIGFRLQGQDWLAHNHSDSYPTSLGWRVIQDVLSLDLHAARDFVSKLVPVESDALPDEAQLRELWEQLALTDDLSEELRQSTEDRRTFDTLIPELRGGLSAHVERGLRFWDNYETFALDMSCQWGYVLNLDDESLEVYTGNWTARLDRFRPKLAPKGRYAKHTEREPADHPMHFVQGIPLTELRMLPTWALLQWCERVERSY